MDDSWLMLCIGIGLIFFGIFATHIRGAMPGSSLRSPVPLRFRLILIIFGVFMSVLGAARLLRK